MSGLLLVRCAAGDSLFDSSTSGRQSTDGASSVFVFPGASSDEEGASSELTLSQLCGTGSCSPDSPSNRNSSEDDCESIGVGGAAGAGGASAQEGDELGFGGNVASPEEGNELACSVVVTEECSGESCDVKRACRQVGVA